MHMAAIYRDVSTIQKLKERSKRVFDESVRVNLPLRNTRALVITHSARAIKT